MLVKIRHENYQAEISVEVNAEDTVHAIKTKIQTIGQLSYATPHALVICIYDHNIQWA
jgi:hypothetical protein